MRNRLTDQYISKIYFGKERHFLWILMGYTCSALGKFSVISDSLQVNLNAPSDIRTEDFF